MKIKAIIIGYGVVAKEFIKLILNNSDNIKEKYGFELLVTGIIGSKGMIYQENGIKLDALVKYSTGSEALCNYAQNNNIEINEPILSGELILDCTPTNSKDGEPGLTYLLKAMELGMDVVSVSKGALVHSFSKVINTAKKNRVTIKYSGATAAALPTLDIGEYSLAGCNITKIEGIFNGTSNFILTNMAHTKVSYKQALKIAKEQGIAESNPHLDTSGFDTAFKILLLANSLLGTNYTIKDVNVTGIEDITMETVEAAKSNGRTIKLLGSAYKDAGKIHLEVRPSELDESHPLYGVKGTNKGILFDTSEMGVVCATGGASNPRGAAMAALKDLINIYRENIKGTA